ncbi:hypothetical protein JKF63_00345 [Porcisia hertigi]|uniref:Uncharacterized protein n=1 Tax=Porcisia hertigi TaxID=2761500 RepID=A0A836I4T2_9TRYP|nr:hypothetical protein JKF63_00345 [Porcisia hertigi]
MYTHTHTHTRETNIAFLAHHFSLPPLVLVQSSTYHQHRRNTSGTAVHRNRDGERTHTKIMFRHSSSLMRRAVSAFLKEPGQAKPFHETLAASKAENTDLASMLSSDFLLLQSKLVKYRIARLGEETQYVVKHPFSCFPSADMMLLHLLALPGVFFTAMCIGRGSSRSLVKPPTAKTAPAAAADQQKQSLPSSQE